MKTTVNEWDFKDAFRNYGRLDNFSMEGLAALYDYYTELEESTGEEIELDVIAICVEWCEYDTLEEALKEYDLDNLEDLQDHTSIRELDNGHILVEQF